MNPPFLVDYFTNVTLTYAKFYSYFRLRKSTFSKLLDGWKFRPADNSWVPVLFYFIVHIFLVRSQKKVIWFYAGRIVTFVENAYSVVADSLRNIAIMNYPRSSVRKESAASKFKMSISILYFAACPVPACVSLVDLGKKSANDFGRLVHINPIFGFRGFSVLNTLTNPDLFSQLGVKGQQ